MIYFLAPYPMILSRASQLNKENLLSEKDHLKASRYIRAEDRDRFIAARILFYAYLKSKTPYVTSLQELYYDRYGKPVLDVAEFNFNWSHSGEMIALIAGGNGCGIDVECHSDKLLFDYRSICTKKELEWLTSGGEKERFYQLWTAKESVMKALGTGLSVNPVDIEISYDKESGFTGKVRSSGIYYGVSRKIIEKGNAYSLSWCTDVETKVRYTSASSLFNKLSDNK